MSKSKNYDVIKEYYQNAFKQYGDTPKGLAWQDELSMETRFDVMAGLMMNERTAVKIKPHRIWPEVKVIDLGCGTGHFLNYLLWAVPNIKYEGIDINSEVINFCQNHYSDKFNFSTRDILEDPLPANYCNYIVANGILTVKDSLSFDEMWDFAKKLITHMYESASDGIAFNVMSKQVDWEREDLFHLSLDTLADFLTKNISRHFIIRNDYNLYEYTTYIYKKKWPG